tara:strand:- start:3293 stop:4630 length:1338 start_codon:yes stop_codon:yes gene_type:complete
MFNMGGPIKQGIMNNIREPYKGGGKAALVGNPVYPQTGGREHHAVPLLALAPSIARAIPAVYRGFKAARTFAPGKLGKFKRLKSFLSPSGRFRDVAGKKRTDPSAAYMKGDFTASAGTAGTAPSRLGIFQALKDPTRLGAAIRENPLTALSSLTLPNLIGTAAYKAAPGAAKGALGIAKRYADAIIPGDQSSWYTPEEPPKGIEKPGGFSKAKVATKKTKTLTDEQRKDFAKSQRDARVQKYMDLMGYDKTRKNAAYDALIDAGRMVSERGTLDPKNITSELINPIVAATSKRFDKPEQIREAVGLMMSKADLEKEMYEAKPGTIMKTAQDLFKSGYADSMDEAIRIATKEPRGVGEALTAFAISSKGSLKDKDISLVIRDYGYKNNVPVDVVPSEQLIEEYGQDITKHPSATEILQEKGITEDGIYQIGSEVIEIVGGKPQKRI